jgi:hypothetical protein
MRMATVLETKVASPAEGKRDGGVVWSSVNLRKVSYLTISMSPRFL